MASIRPTGVQPAMSSLKSIVSAFFENTSPQQLATLIGSASIASSLGYQLYSKHRHHAKYHHSSGPAAVTAIDYKDYKRILTASAPGKVILSGEHAVVYGVTAVSTAIDKRTSVAIYEPIDFHRVINLNDNAPRCGSPTNSTLVLKLEAATLRWKMSDLIAIHNLNGNKWSHKLIQKEYRSLRPSIAFADSVTADDIERHPLYRHKHWDRQITSVVLLLLFQCFHSLFGDALFISYGILIDVTSDIPIGVGLGSSAAWSTSISAALYYYWVYVTAGQRKTKLCSSGQQTVSRVWKLAFESEKINHGTPSGIDNTTSVYGGYIRFKTKGDFQAIDPKKEFVHKVPILVVNTGTAGNTKKLVHGVRALHSTYSAILQPLFESVESIGQCLMRTLIDEELAPQDLSKTVHELFAMNHGVLQSLGVGHPSIDRVKTLCNGYGLGKGFKITGAGGGGCVIVSLLSKKGVVDPERVRRLRNTLKTEGFESYLIETGQNGMSCRFH